MSSRKSKSIMNLYEGVVDMSKSHNKALENMGVNSDEIRDAETMMRAVQQFVSQVSFAAKRLGGLAERVAGESGQAISASVDMIVKAAAEMRKAAAQSTQSAGKSSSSNEPEDPRKGFADDPDAKTRGKEHPGRSYRAG